MVGIIFVTLLFLFYASGLVVAVLLDKKRGKNIVWWQIMADICIGNYFPSFIQFSVNPAASKFRQEMVDVANKYLSGVVFAVYLLLGLVVSVYLVGKF